MARRRARRPGPLDARSRAILRAIIEEHVATAVPVGSQTLCEKYGLGVSSATVRSTMAELEAVGLISHPHTSAGRIPSDSGYRYYVESIAEHVALAPVEQLMIRHQFGQVEYSSEQWFRLAAATLAAATHAAGLATPAKPPRTRFKRIALAAVQPRLAGLVFVPLEGSLRQALVSFNVAATQAELDAAAATLNGAFAGRTAAQIESRAVDLDGLAGAITRRVVAIMHEVDASLVETLFSEGLLNVMAAPEFAITEKLRRVMGALQDHVYLARLVETVARRGDVQVFIGHENPLDEMRDVSLVVAPYGQPGHAVGIVGVLGPTRMAYPHAISSVRYVSGLMSELVGQLYS
ncbi:MAG: heat-inducible transcription repressor HrcA [Chloroflexi bacterium GWC2_73_18]|nr:MAG: heat-inducible transcription repressor HrcA [Chloroflexi bacterium GWC2_73_18]